MIQLFWAADFTTCCCAERGGLWCEDMTQLIDGTKRREAEFTYGVNVQEPLEVADAVDFTV